MRTLLLLRGAPGCGKSTWIKNNGLEAYTLCPDELRKLCSSPDLQPDGHFTISQERNNEAAVWEVLFKILEHRMERGEFTVIDATCSKTKDMQQYKDLAQQYRYRMFIVDFTDVLPEVCKAQNKMRPELKWVPETAIDNIYARFATQKVPAGITIIKPDEFNTILEKPIDLSNYKKVVFVGDIHGCFDTLMQYPDFKNGLDPEIEYVFLGDYFDRGNQNAEVLKWLYSIMDLENVCLLEGNHERWLNCFGNNVPSKSKEFEDHTKLELYAKGFTEKEARMLYRKCRQFSHFTWNGLEILACHGGIPNLNTNLLYLPSIKLIHGVGGYGDYLAVTDSWMGQTKDNQYLIHGHRNTEASETKIADRVFNLEGRVEFGGQLRIVELTLPVEGVWAPYLKDDGTLDYSKTFKWNVVELEDCQPITETLNTEERQVETVEEAVSYLRNNKFVQEKQLGNGISSFNFTRDAFMKGNWNRQTILARGLFIDTENNQIIARSYEKFFRINEVHETELANLKQKLVFPVTAYVKENGFLAIVSYDYKNDDLFIASKSTNKGDYVDYIRKQLEPYKEKIKVFLKAQYEEDSELHISMPRSLVFECVDIENDPHIIEEDEPKFVLLDCINNTLDYCADKYEFLKMVADTIGCPVKEKAFELKDWDAFRDLYDEMSIDQEWKHNNKFIEGFVFVDQVGFQTKAKSAYYNFWKHMRSVADQTLRQGYIRSTGSLNSSEANLFYGFCKELYNKYYDKETKTYPFKTDIISLRKMFLNRNN